MSKNKKESMMKGITVLLLSQISIKVIGLAYKLYLTNKEEFGDTGNAIYSSGFQIYALLLTFSSTGVPNAISKLVSERLAVGDSKGARKIFRISFITFAILGALGSIILFLGAKTIATKWIQIPEAEISLICLAPSIFFVSISSVIRGYFNGMQDFSATAKSQSFEQIFKTVFTVALVELSILAVGRNTKIMAGAANLATTFATISSFFYVFIYYRIRKNYIDEQTENFMSYKPMRIRKTIKKIINVAFPISISSLIASLGKSIDSFTVVRFLKLHITEENAKIQYGILSGKVDVLCALPLSINTAFITTLVPNISKSMAKGNLKEVRRKAKLFILISILISVPITFVMYFFSEQILTLLFPNATAGSMYLKYNSLAIVFMLLSQTVNAILQGIGKVNVPWVSFGIGMIFKFICNVVLIPIKEIGIFGAIIGNIICNIIAFIIGFTVLYKSLNFNFKIKSLKIKPILKKI